MAKKHLIKISENKELKSDCKVFEISFAHHLLWLVVFSAFDLRVFNKGGNLARFIQNFKEPEMACYMLFSSFGGVRGASSVTIDKVLDMTDSYLCLDPIIPDKWAEKILISFPNPIYFLILREHLERITDIFAYIDSIDTRCDFIFLPEAKKDWVYAEIRDLHKKKNLGETGLLTLKAEMATLRIGKYGAEDSFKIFTRRFNIEQVQKIFLGSLDQEKFEVETE